SRVPPRRTPHTSTRIDRGTVIRRSAGEHVPQAVRVERKFDDRVPAAPHEGPAIRTNPVGYVVDLAMEAVFHDVASLPRPASAAAWIFLSASNTGLVARYANSGWRFSIK